MSGKIITFQGKRIDELPREELIEALTIAIKETVDSREALAQHTRMTRKFLGEPQAIRS